MLFSLYFARVSSRALRGTAADAHRRLSDSVPVVTATMKQLGGFFARGENESLSPSSVLRECSAEKVKKQTHTVPLSPNVPNNSHVVRIVIIGVSVTRPTAVRQALAGRPGRSGRGGMLFTHTPPLTLKLIVKFFV